MIRNNEEVFKGNLFAIAAYTIWGFFPIYWKLLQSIPSLEVMMHRILWSFLFYYLVNLIFKKRISLLPNVDFKVFALLFAASLLLMTNWFLYIYAVNSNQIVESSLGYFINPLFNVLMGIFILKENLSRMKLISVLLAAVGVSVIAFSDFKIPWIALTLAVTFSFYGLIKKKCRIDASDSNQIESLIFVLPSLGYLFLYGTKLEHLVNQPILCVYLIISGIITGVPLLFFTGAAKRIPYYQMGFYQFISPTLQFLCGVILFNEPVSYLKLSGFVFIWLSSMLLIYEFYKNSAKRMRFI